MGEHYHNDGGHGGLYFIVGAVVVVLGVLAVLYFNGDLGEGIGKPDTTIKIETPRPAPAPTR